MKIRNLTLKKARRILLNTIFTTCFAVLINISVSAATITVINTADSGAGSLRQAIADAASGDTIDFNLGCPCTITLASTLIINNKSLIISGPGANQLTISGNNAVRVFTIQGVTQPPVTISGLTIANGTTAATGGGGIFLLSGTLTVSNSIIRNNSTTIRGGGIFLSPNTKLHLIDSTLTQNSSNSDGGGIFADSIGSNGSSLTIVNSTISDNNARLGGGVYISVSSNLTSANTNYTNNTASFDGGGIYNLGTAAINSGTINLNDALSQPGPITGGGGGILNGGTLNLSKVNVASNTTTGDGGGILSGGNLTVNDSTIASNQSSASGGGIKNSSVLTISASTLSGNQTTDDGGGIDNSGTLNITNSTFSGNQALNNSGGGGINNNNNSTTNLSFSTLAFNSALFGGGVINGNSNATFNIDNTIIAQNTSPNGPDGNGIFVSKGFNLIGNNDSITGFTNGTNRDIVGTNNSPVNPLLNPLSNNGGFTQTHALQSASPAIDRGGTAFGIVTDQRGNARFLDATTTANIPGGSNSDIGAFEFLAPTAVTVGVGGKVLTADARGIRNATLLLIDSYGNFQTVKTGNFGYFRFADVEAGETYVLIVRSKRFRFTPQIITITDEISDLNLVAEPENAATK